jgi:hypothetical protein
VLRAITIHNILRNGIDMFQPPYVKSQCNLGRASCRIVPSRTQFAAHFFPTTFFLSVNFLLSAIFCNCLSVPFLLFQQVFSSINMSREENVYMAKLSEQAERYEEMVEYMEKVAKTVDVELTIEERNLLSVAYKNVIGARRASWRIVSSIEQKEESRKNEDHVSLIKEYRGKIEAELSNICDGILKLLDSHLVPSSTAGESKVFYLKMKGDYHRLGSATVYFLLHRISNVCYGVKWARAGSCGFISSLPQLAWD